MSVPTANWVLTNIGICLESVPCGEHESPAAFGGLGI